MVRWALTPIAAALALAPLAVQAACTTVGNATTCTSAAPNPSGTTIGSGASTPTNSSLSLQNNAQIVLGNANAVSLGNAATITLATGALIQNTATSGAGLYGSGTDTVETNNNGSITLSQGSSIIANGTQHNAEAINVEGSGNTVTNNGTIQGVHSAAIWFQNISGGNTIVNNATGVIESTVNVIGSTGNGFVDFTNKGQVIGNLTFAGGNDVLNLFTGSSISGSFNGGGGTNTINLMGTGSASLPGAILNFQSLNKTDSGTWTLTGSITGGMAVTVQQGTLVLGGNNAQFTGSVLVDAAGTLQGSSGTLPPSVSNNGTVQFAQNTAGTYGGLISGTGLVVKQGSGVLTLAGANNYSGGTQFDQGTINVGADGALGAATGSLTFAGGSLQFGSSFNLASTRAITLNAGGGTLDTQSFTTALAQGITGPGALTKIGGGTLTLTGANSYGGGTTIGAGTLQLGNGGTSGSITGNVVDNGTLIFDRSDVVTYAGAISGSGSLIQAGSGTLVLTANDSQTGLTTVQQGTLRLNASLASDALVAPGATLSGDGLIGGSVDNSGTIAPGDGGNSGALTIAGNYDSAGGLLLVHTLVDAGGPGNEFTSRLLIDGNAMGSTVVRVIVQNGSIAQVTGNTNLSGISVIQVAGQSSLGSFSSGPYSVVLGPYTYRLFYFPSPYAASSELNPKLGALGATTFSDYRLQSVIVQPYSPLLPIEPAPGGGEITKGGIGPGGVYVPEGLPVGIGPDGELAGQPVVAPQVLAYRALPMASLQFGYALVDDLHRRLGEITQEAADPGVETFVRAQNWSDTFRSADLPSIDQNAWFLQLGAGRVYSGVLSEGDHLHLDAIAAIGHSSFGIDVNNSHAQFDAQSVGATATYQAARGWYLDGVLLQSDYHNMSVQTAGQGQVASADGNGFVASLEGGLPFHFGDALVVEPRASVAYQRVAIGNFTDIDSVTFHLDSGNSSQERVGVRVIDTFTRVVDADTQLWSPFATLDYVHDPQGNNREILSGASFVADTTGNSLRGTLGLNVQMTHALALYVDGERMLQRTSRGASGTAANIGVRYTF